MNCRYMFIAVTATISMMVCGCKNGERNELAHNHAHDNNEITEHDNGKIIIEPEIAAKFGIRTDTVAAKDFASGLTLTGQLLTPSSEEAIVSASTSGTLTMNPNIMVGAKVAAGQQIGKIAGKSLTGDDPNALAKANMAAAKREIERLKPLLDDGIVTMSEYNAAVAAYESAKATFSNAAVAGTVKSPITGTVTQLLVNTGQFVETGTPLARVSRNQNLVLRVDFPEQEKGRLTDIADVKIRVGTDNEWITLSELSGKRIDSGEFPVLSGYLPVFYSFKNNGNLSSGSYVEVSMTGTPTGSAIVILQSAVIEQQGEKYVYVKTGDHEYEKRRVSVAGKSGDELSISSGLKAGEVLVTEGATVVKMAESSGAVPEGHSHSH